MTDQQLDPARRRVVVRLFVVIVCLLVTEIGVLAGWPVFNGAKDWPNWLTAVWWITWLVSLILDITAVRKLNRLRHRGDLARAAGAHVYDPDPRDTVNVPRCICGMTRAYRSHQPWWWRLMHPAAKWR